MNNICNTNLFQLVSEDLEYSTRVTCTTFIILFEAWKSQSPFNVALTERKRANSNFRIVFQWRKKVFWVRKLWFFKNCLLNYFNNFNTLPDWPLRDMESLQSSYEKTAIMMVYFMRVLWLMVSFKRVLCLVKVTHRWNTAEEILYDLDAPHCFYLDVSYFLRHIL